mmetsp:Transcript_59362/g.141529  ORF Transcript_59362/g.141529 Transcript_59362/m.141529 type:complete len:131 (+) Transcript_59362:137-529(+)
MGAMVKPAHLVTSLPLMVMGLLLSGIGEADGRPMLRIVGLTLVTIGLLFLIVHLVLLGWQSHQRIAERRTVAADGGRQQLNPVARAIEMAQRRPGQESGRASDSEASTSLTEGRQQQRPLMDDEADAVIV